MSGIPREVGKNLIREIEGKIGIESLLKDVLDLHYCIGCWLLTISVSRTPMYAPKRHRHQAFA